MDLRYARSGDAVRELWRLCFDGDAAETYFSREYDPARCLVQVTDSGEPVSMLHWVDRSLRFWDENVRSAYVLGVATHPLYRRQGLAGELIEQLFFELHLRKIPLAFLLPGGRDACSLYSSYGFRQVGVGQTSAQTAGRIEAHAAGQTAAGEACAAGFRPADYEDVAFLSAEYDKLTSGRPHVVREPEHWELIIDEYRVMCSQDGYAVYSGGVCLEDSRSPLLPTPLSMYLRIVGAREILALAETKGQMVPRAVYDDWCPWNNSGGSQSDDRLEKFYFSGVYANLLYNERL